MGMGEPFYNFRRVRDALLSAAYTKASVSPAAASRCRPRVVPNIVPYTGEDIGVMLAISLPPCATNCAPLVPLNRKYPIAELFRPPRHPGSSNALAHHV